jgi:hypothetical protein
VPTSLNVSSLSEIPTPDWSQKSSKSAASASALLGSNVQEDHRFLEEIFFQKQWMLFRTESVRDALSVLEWNEIPVVISEQDVPGGGWKKILSALQRLPRPPLLVVTSGLAYEHLWAEVLNLGGHDVLALPFSAKELVWVMENAWRRFGFTFGAEKTEGVCGRFIVGGNFEDEENERQISVPAPQATATARAKGESQTQHGDPTAHDEIAALAYSFWEARGYQGGSQEEDWLRAEEELRKRDAQLRMPKQQRAATKSTGA